jgi:hypothetical protein
MSMHERRVRRAIVAGAFVALVAAVTGARLWNPPFIGFVIGFTVTMAGVLLVVALDRVTNH